MEAKRPDPDELLKTLRAESGQDTRPSPKGRLKVFLGYCAGVGKTYTMLREAAQRVKAHEDIVIGIVETHNRKDTEALVEGFEVIPRKKMRYKELLLEEMDIDALLARKPSIALVDEFAHSNVPGSRHAKRYQDVEELLNAGIDVCTTLNIQHVESMVDIVEQVSGVKVDETIPNTLLEQADEIELVDVTPEKLLERLSEGKVYIPRKAEQAMRKFFKKGNLLALRELSLKYTAKQVDGDARSYLIAHATAGPWPAGSRLMTAISPSPSSGRLLRFTHRMAQDLDAEWYAVYVESPHQAAMTEKDRFQIEKNIRLAEELGAVVVLLQGTDLAAEMLGFARGKDVTLIVVGPSKRNWLERLRKGSVVHTLIKNSGAISVLVANSGQQEEPAREYRPSRRISVGSYAGAFLAVAAATGAGILLRSMIDPLNIAMMLLLPAIASGVFGGMRVGFFASLLAAGAFDFFFVPPYGTFAITDMKYLPALVIFILVSLIASYLAKSMRQGKESSLHRERFIYSLYAFTKMIMDASDLDSILSRAVKSMYEAFEYDVAVMLPDRDGNLRVAASNTEHMHVNEMEQAVATWVYVNSKPAGRGTNTLSSSSWYFIPMKVQDRVIGTIGLHGSGERQFLTPDQDQLFESLAGVVALAVLKASR